MAFIKRAWAGQLPTELPAIPTADKPREPRYLLGILTNKLKTGGLDFRQATAMDPSGLRALHLRGLPISFMRLRLLYRPFLLSDLANPRTKQQQQQRSCSTTSVHRSSPLSTSVISGARKHQLFSNFCIIRCHFCLD